jgi:hypothetical protein
MNFVSVPALGKKRAQMTVQHGASSPLTPVPDIDQVIARGGARRNQNLIRVLDRTPTAATMKGPHATPAPGYLTAYMNQSLTASQGDHRAIFNPGTAATQAHVGYLSHHRQRRCSATSKMTEGTRFSLWPRRFS